ncbi:RAQPRD family integrative conjugative element protein [Thiomicrospira sp.]|uniref:integrative conjugative element protein, RAQPRD family n=1 Tax=Thiomicrospira sp. TaxID=935 RepID=UPI002F92719A
MKKHVLFIIFPLLYLVGCQTTPEQPAKQVVVDENQVEESDHSIEPMVKEVSGSTVVVKPTYYNYEISDQSTAERKALLDILAHLQQLDGLIAVAKANQNPDQRIKFRYDWLQTDMYKITRGISDHLSSPDSQPRVVEPIDGDYRR